MEKLLNIQLFSTTTAKVGATATFYGANEAQAEAHEYVSKNIEDAIYEEDELKEYFGDEILPLNHGKTMILRKWDKYNANITEYKSGATITADSPQKQVEIRVALKGYAGYAEYDDEADIFSLDNGVADRISRGQGASLGEKITALRYRALQATTNKWFMGATPVASNTLAQNQALAQPFDIDEARKIRTALKRMGVKPFKNGKYVWLISPEIEASMFNLAKSSTKYSFVEIANQNNSSKIFEGAIGEWMGFVFVPLNVIGEVATGITGTFILGQYQNEKGARQVKLEANNNIKSIIHPIGSAGSADPLDSVGTIGWKMYAGYAIKHPEAVMEVYCANTVEGDYNYPDVSSLALADSATATVVNDGSSTKANYKAVTGQKKVLQGKVTDVTTE